MASYVYQFEHEPLIVDLNILFNGKKLTSEFFRKAALKILSYKPQVLGFGVICASLPVSLLIAKECKKLAPKLPIIFGGPEVSFEEAAVLKVFKQVDIIVRGEGENTLVEILDALAKEAALNDILGITYRKKKRVIRNPDRPFIKSLDDLPYLNFSLLPHLSKYNKGEVEAGRGCPFQCTFCSTCKMWKRNFRMKSARRLVQELQQVYSFFNDRKNPCVPIIHDNLLASRKRIERFLSLLKGRGIPWTCSARLEALDESLIRKLEKAGCRNIYLGIESGSPYIQKKIKKRLPLAKLPKILAILSKYDIAVTLSFIIGFPYENKHQINQTLWMALRSKLYDCLPIVQVHPFTFLKGSELYEEVKKRSLTVEFLQTDTSPLLTNLSSEVSLVKHNPSIFPSFYSLKRKDFSHHFFEKTCILFHFLIEIFPLTTLLFLKLLSYDPLPFSKKVVSFFEGEGLSWSIFQEDKQTYHHYLPFFTKFIKKHATQLIKEVFYHEELFQNVSLIEKAEVRRDVKLGFDSFPKVARGVKIKIYNYDVLGMVDYVKHNKGSKIRKTKCYVAYVPGETTQAIKLDVLSHDLIGLCNGKRTIKEIIYQGRNCKEKHKQIPTRFFNIFMSLMKCGVITISHSKIIKGKDIVVLPIFQAPTKRETWLSVVLPIFQAPTKRETWLSLNSISNRSGALYPKAECKYCPL
ncbi:MAG: B12-binding domain-containing radical SAM protein [Candidatus Margulisbacteria bacterium]|nr:B12-binding domain-containing radical SAM protein [Candidatus Margulisiibacteriota bacterium]